ncbi:hypothetical protein [Staphylococcus phage vB_StaM_PB50]|nr:hypothetical protein [Staphylococcus phage vB_StaM_PB50]
MNAIKRIIGSDEFINTVKRTIARTKKAEEKFYDLNNRVDKAVSLASKVVEDNKEKERKIKELKEALSNEKTINRTIKSRYNRLLYKNGGK